MKEKKERNNRVGFGISSAHGANGISTLPTTSAQIQINDQNEAEMGEVGLEVSHRKQAELRN
jgi:hypothetical protein